MLMEQSDVKIHMIHSLADDKIPFCPYFIIPYVLWYFFLIGTVIYFAVFCPSKKEYYQYLGTLGVGMTLFLLISYVYPNGQHLRPDLGSTGGGVFISVIRLLYKIDTPTNIFPSMHVFNATASCIALYQNERCRKNKLFTVSQINRFINDVPETAQCGRCYDCTDPEYSLLSAVLQSASGKKGTPGRSTYTQRDLYGSESAQHTSTVSGSCILWNI